MSITGSIAASVVEFCRAVRDQGGRALLVGGFVRDLVRGVSSSDYDIEVYGLEPNRLRSLLGQFGAVNAVGEAFTVYKLRFKSQSDLIVDVSLPRRESRTGRGHRSFVVTGDPGMSVEEAARRRDFTINSIMLDPLTEEFLDPWNGREDIGRGLLKAVDPSTFVEDSLRVLRAVQFAARFDYHIEESTAALCRQIDLSDLPAERIWGEVEKWLLASERPSIGLYVASDLDVTRKLWPEIWQLSGCAQDPLVHPEGDVFTHTALVLDQARLLTDGLSKPKAITVMLAALCHDLGKPLAADVKRHDIAGIGPTQVLLDRYKLFTIDGYDVRGQVAGLVEHHLKPHRWFKAQKAGETITDGDFRRLARKVELDLLYRVARADCLGRTGDFRPDAEEWFAGRVRELGLEEKAPEALLLGRHVLALGMTPGPRIGEITRAVYEEQLDGRVTTLEEAIDAARRLIE